MGNHISLVLFDCDETLWHSSTRDYVGRVISPFRRVDAMTVERVADQVRFSIDPSVRETFSYLRDCNIGVGIVSDNVELSVTECLKLFGLYTYIDLNAFSVRLWKGHCPKEVMVQEVLKRVSAVPAEVILIDDKDYHQAMGAIGVRFYQKHDDDNMLRIIRKVCPY